MTDPTGLFSVKIAMATISVYSSQIAMTVGASAFALTSVYGAAGYVMLHDEIVGLFSAVHSIATGRGEDGEQLTMAGYMFAFALLAVTVVPGDFADDALRQISAFRAAKNLPTQHTGNRAADGVVAVLRIDGDDYIAHNKWMSDEGTNLVDVIDELHTMGVSPNAITPGHAEGGVLMQALRDGKVASTAELFVDATFCGACGESRGLLAFAKALGLEELVVHVRLSNGHVVRGNYNLAPVAP